MTTTLHADGPAAHAVVRDARRAWYLAGVRRRDRAMLTAELRGELAAAEDVRDVLGDDPASAAREWAAERGLTDRRVRLLVVLPAALLPGVLPAGGVLALLYQGFTANGGTLLNRVSAPTRLEIYLATSVLSYAAMLVGVATALSWVHDTTARSTVRILAVTLPVGAVLATLTGVGTAQAQQFGTDRQAVLLDVAAILITLALVLSASRRVVVHRPRP